MSPSRGYRGISYCLKLGQLRFTQLSIFQSRHARFFYSIPEKKKENYDAPGAHFPPSPLAALQTQFPTQCALKDLLPSSTAQLSKFQLYISTSTNPYINLATEQHIFNSCVNAARAHERAQKDPVKENGVVTPYQHPVILMLYINSPCVVIGRNQNPWVEVNIPRILSSREGKTNSNAVWLLRRRSGGGTVYHDLGNVNYSAIVPATGFTRDQHAEMVVDALKSGGADGKGVRVNERHDVVMAAGGVGVGGAGGEVAEVKLSGSAYKLTRTTALHHGTMLIGAELKKVRSFIDSGARPWIKGRGVASVRSPIANVGLEGGVVRFAEEVGKAWKRYNALTDSNEKAEGGVAVCFITEEVALDIPEILEGKNEMQSSEWTFDQTPRFTFSIPITQDLITASSTSTVSLPPAPEDLENPDLPTIQVICDKGLITGVELGIQGSDLGEIEISGLRESLVGKQFDGGYIVDALHRHGVHQNAYISRWIEQILGRIPDRNS